MVAMGTPYMIVSSGLLVLEIALQIYVAVAHSTFSDSLFITLLAITMGPIIIINFISAIQVTRTQDFSEKKFGRAICIGFHSFQLGMIWRSLKLVILYDARDWAEFLVLRILHAGFHSLPYAIVLTVSLFLFNSSDALSIVSAIVSLISAAVALTSYRLGKTLYESEEFETKTLKIKRNIGVNLLVFSKLLLIFCRCACISLFSIVQPAWIALILGIHYFVMLLSGIIKSRCSHKLTILTFLKMLYMSFINVFDLTGKGYQGIKCSYVFYYTAVLVENIVMSACWMLTSDLGERFKLMTVFLVLMCFIVGMIVKFTSCGCVFRIEENLLDDAFNNPVVKANADIEVTVPKSEPASNGVISSPTVNQPASSPRAISRGKSPSNEKRSNSNNESVSTSSKNRSKRSYDNNAFVSSQGNVNATQDNREDAKSAKTTTNNSGSSGKKKTVAQDAKSIKGSYGDLASSYSRNTNTLNSGNTRYYNGFDDPFRERNRIQVHLTSTAKRNSRSQKNRSRAHKLKTIYGTNNRYSSSIDSSELYPSMSSISSSSVSYANTKDRIWNTNPNTRMKPYSLDKYDGYTTDISNSEIVSFNDYSMEDSSSWTESSSDSDGAITWPPSHTAKLLKMYNISDSVSSKENVMHWLDNIDPNIDNSHDLSFPTVNDLSMMTDDGTDISMTAMQTFEVKKKDRIRLKKFLPKTKEVFLKFRSLNYKGNKSKELSDRPYPLNQRKQKKGAQEKISINPVTKTVDSAQSTVQFRPNIMQESIV